jgi:hypothetical protein
MTRPSLVTARRLVWLGLFAVVAATAGGVACVVSSDPPSPAEPGPVLLPPEPPEAAADDVHRMCGACHAYPPADTFPRAHWRKEVAQAYEFFHRDSTLRFPYPPIESVIKYYEARAPEALATIPQPTTPPPPAPVRFDVTESLRPEFGVRQGVAHIALAHLFHPNKTDIVVCDALKKKVLAFRPYESPPAWRTLAKDLCCVHAEVVDLDGDGIKDVVLACIGSFFATDDRVGSVVWLKGAADGTFTPVTLLDGLGRVADVRVADFSGTGRLDLVVAEFGWRKLGSVLLLENKTTDWAKPTFVPRVLDDRHGATHVPIADLNGDGKPDFVAVISQEHETVVAFLNEGGGRFRKETLFTAPHPTFGSNGVALADLNGDGTVDVILSNGDSLDPPYLLRPDHGITWLENKGVYPFTPHRLVESYGAFSPVVADFDGNGLPDVAFVTFLPFELFPQRTALRLDAVVLLAQVAPGRFVRHTLETMFCDHMACAAGDWDGTGRPGLVVGNFLRSNRQPVSGIKLWRNMGKP